MKINFLLIGEGSSDVRLVNHIENILIDEGFSEVSGDAPDLSLFPSPIGRSVEDKLKTLVKYYPNSDIIFIHRDADGSGLNQRSQEILNAANGIVNSNVVIPVIPVTMLETWLLADLEAIKRVAGKPKTNSIKCVPALNRLESHPDTKRLLMDALCEASETQGTRLQKFKSRFYEMRARLTTDLDSNGPVNNLPSYKKFREHVTEFTQSRLKSWNNSRAFSS